MVLFALWVLALLITIFGGMLRSVYRGWRMLAGREAEATTGGHSREGESL